MTTRAFWSEVSQLASSIDQCSYYQLLDVSVEAVPEAVREAFVRRVTVFHPDRHAVEIETDPARGRALVSLQARFNEAYRVLSNPRRRTEYDRAVTAGQLRLVGRAVTQPAAADPSSQRARRYLELGRECERSSDRQGAAMYYGFALQLEADSAEIRAALARLGIAAPADPGATAAPSALPDSAAPRADAIAPATPPRPEPRAHDRHPFSGPIQLRCHSWKQFVTLHTRDLSRGGLFVKTAAPLAIGTRVQLSLVMPDGATLDLVAEVTHVVTADLARPDAMVGMGLRFEPDAEQRRHIDALVGHAIAAVAKDGAAR